jgi:nitroreductase
MEPHPMDVFEAFAKRHSYRGPFAETPVPREDLQRIVQAGIQAPSGKNGQTTTFVIIDDAEIIRRINAMPGANTAVRQGRAMIACIVDRDPAPMYEQYSFQVEDCAAAVENMLLAITALGYATVWIDGWLRVQDRAAAIGQMIDLPDTKVIRVLLPIGTPLETWSQKEKLPFEQRAWFNRHDNA